MNFYIDSTMPQEGINPQVQSHASYEASILPPSHHGWILSDIVRFEFVKTELDTL